MEGHEIFFPAGIDNIWTNPETVKSHRTYSILTTEANELMSEIHNTKKRMPVCLSSEMDKDWLEGSNLQDFSFANYNPNLVAEETAGGIVDLSSPAKNSD